jgi:hypothetical protein
MAAEQKTIKKPNSIPGVNIKGLQGKDLTAPGGLCIRYGAFHRCHFKGLYCLLCYKVRKRNT